MRLVPGAPDLVLEELHRDLHVDARAVAGLAVGIDRAPVPHRLERRDPGLDHPARPLARDIDDQPDAAGGVLALLVVERRLRHLRAALDLGAFPVGEIMGHASSPSTNGECAS